MSVLNVLNSTMELQSKNLNNAVPVGGIDTVSMDGLQNVWHQLNARYFQGRLLPIPIVWSRRLTASVGMFVSRVGPRAPQSGPQGPAGTDRRLIRLSIPLLQDQSEQELIGTLAHEMIHQWQYDILKRRPNHGPEFTRMMALMNHDGLGVTIRHSLDTAVHALTKYTWRCTECGCDYHRQRKTIRPRHHRCGKCLGTLRELTRRPSKDLRSPISAEPEFVTRANPTVMSASMSALQMSLPFVNY